MSQFFIHRPIFAWVIAIFITFVGLLAMPNMPVEQYPEVAPPTITIKATYPGASAEEISRSVLNVIETELNGIDDLLYYSSTADSTGNAQIKVVFKPGTDDDIAQVNVQNRVSNITSSLPEAVMEQGVRYSKGNSNTLMVVSIYSKDGSMTPADVGDYVTRNIQNDISRVPGVGTFQLFSSPRAMRIWADPNKLTSFGLTMADITSAITAQHGEISAGVLGAPPEDNSLTTTAIISVNGELSNVDEFQNIILRANSDGSIVRLKDVARVEVGQNSYQMDSTLDGKPVVSYSISPSTGANALETEQAVIAEMNVLSKYFPAGLTYSVPYDTAPYVSESINKVLHTLVEAIVLVFIVMFIFLQNIRYTIIPAIVVPVALMGTLGVLWGLGYSVNTLTMFAMVLAIGILVDDAIVVVENVERIMSEDNLPPKQATIKGMPQISSAIIGITLVLIVVFFPLIFMSGSSGVIYRQFAVSMAVSIGFSGFLALTFTPALCATFLKPIKNHGQERKGFFGWFNRNFEKVTNRYTGFVGKIVKRAGRLMIIYFVLAIVSIWLFMELPSSFLPDEDQGVVMTNIELPSGVSASRTDKVVAQASQFFQKQPAVDHVVGIRGFSFNGTGINSGIMFVTLKDFAKRTESAQAISAKATGALLFGIPDASIFAITPPPIPSLGNASGFEMYLQDRGSLGVDELRNQAEELIALASKDPKLSNVRIASLSPGPTLLIKLDRAKVLTYGVNFADVNTVLSTALGASFIGKFPNMGWMQNVWVQADNQFRKTPDDILKLKVANSQGDLVDLSNFMEVKWSRAQSLVQRYNSYYAIDISGSAAAGVANGDAMKEMDRLISEHLSKDIGYEWTGLSYQEIQAGNQAPIMMALALFVVFLVLSALYESWAIPVAALLIVPLGMLGSVLLTSALGKSNDIYFQIGIVTVIGLATKNAILIVEFAKDAVATGRPLIESTIEAARLRLRPILMTSFAFILGVVPLMIATGAGAAGQRAVGTGVVGGMISATFFSVFFVPIFFVSILSWFKVKPKLLGAHAETQVHEQSDREYQDAIYNEVLADDIEPEPSPTHPNEQPPKSE